MVNSGSRRGNFEHDCYTCNKTPYVEKHVLMRTELFELHAPMGRSIEKNRLTVTPIQHVSDIEELGAEKFMKIYLDIKQFLARYDVKGFEMTFKTGDWMRHDHQHTHVYIERQHISKIMRNINDQDT